MMGVATQLKTLLVADGMDAPVIDPVAASIKLAETLAETMVALGLRQSRLTYPEPKTYQARTAA
jgi:Asp/Glu/hydantoin racemase